jgi:hypothetical protein
VQDSLKRQAPIAISQSLPGRCHAEYTTPALSVKTPPLTHSCEQRKTLLVIIEAVGGLGRPGGPPRTSGARAASREGRR